MLSSDSNIESIAQLVEEIKKYISLKGEYYKVTFAEKAVRIITTIVMTVLLVLIGLIIVGFLSLTVAFALEPKVGRVAAFAIIAGIYLLLFVLCILFRKPWIEAPLVRFFATLLFE